MRLIFLSAFLLSLLYSCRNDDKISPENHFSKTYYDSALHNNYFPVDFDILANKEYLVLSLLKKTRHKAPSPEFM
ncbi:MAG: hypothetical protein HC905_12210 [Bacteroidales bacterium]|nr:hypothetical protein [Bacteroidales bacterium]